MAALWDRRSFFVVCQRRGDSRAGQGRKSTGPPSRPTTTDDKKRSSVPPWIAAAHFGAGRHPGRGREDRAKAAQGVRQLRVGARGGGRPVSGGGGPRRGAEGEGALWAGGGAGIGVCARACFRRSLAQRLGGKDDHPYGAGRRDSDAPDQDEIRGPRALHRLQGNGPIERGEPAVIPNGQTEQIGIRDLLMSADHRRPKERLVQE